MPSCSIGTHPASPNDDTTDLPLSLTKCNFIVRRDGEQSQDHQRGDQHRTSPLLGTHRRPLLRTHRFVFFSRSPACARGRLFCARYKILVQLRGFPLGFTVRRRCARSALLISILWELLPEPPASPPPVPPWARIPPSVTEELPFAVADEGDPPELSSFLFLALVPALGTERHFLMFLTVSIASSSATGSKGRFSALEDPTPSSIAPARPFTVPTPFGVNSAFTPFAAAGVAASSPGLPFDPPADAAAAAACSLAV